MRKREKPDLLETWERDYARDGRVAVGLARRRLWRLLLIGVVFALAGPPIALAPSASTGDRVLGWLCCAMGVACVVVFSAQLRDKDPAVVVDSRGITGRWPWRGERNVPWPEILDASVYRIRGTAMVLLHITPEYEQSWLQSFSAGRVGKILARGNRSLVGGPSIALPTPLDTDPGALAAWIRVRAGAAQEGR